MSPRRSLSHRALAGGLVLLLWLAGLGLLVRREYFRPSTERLAEAAMRVSPGAVFYGVIQNGRQIGFASSTLDTAETTISADDYLVADLPVGGKMHRASARTHVVLSRGMRVKAFAFTFEADAGPITARGRVVGDSLLVLIIEGDERAPADTQRIKLSGPILVPTLLPVAIALGEQPKVGKRYTLAVFDPVGMTAKDVAISVTAESLFVLNDSSTFDSTAGRWTGVRPDTVHAWQLSSETGAGAAGFTGWVDEQGRVVQTAQLGLELRRLPYEVAFENWRLDSPKRLAARAVTEDRDILETTAIGASRRLRTSVTRLRVRLTNASLDGFDLGGPRQELRGDTLTVQRETAAELKASYVLSGGLDTALLRFTQPEPLVQSAHPDIKRLAARIARGSQDPRVVAERVNRWVYDSLKKRITFGIPSALQVLHVRSGDCNEHTQLYVALARAAGIPTRIAAGLAHIDGKFYYHAWPEIYLNGWVAVDPTFGQFPADASHLRFTVGGLGRQAELLRLMGRLKIDVLEARD